jgi:hypothetical protein
VEITFWSLGVQQQKKAKLRETKVKGDTAASYEEQPTTTITFL